MGVATGRVEAAREIARPELGGEEGVGTTHIPGGFVFVVCFFLLASLAAPSLSVGLYIVMRLL